MSPPYLAIVTQLTLQSVLDNSPCVMASMYIQCGNVLQGWRGSFMSFNPLHSQSETAAMRCRVDVAAKE